MPFDRFRSQHLSHPPVGRQRWEREKGWGQVLRPWGVLLLMEYRHEALLRGGRTEHNEISPAVLVEGRTNQSLFSRIWSRILAFVDGSAMNLHLSLTTIITVPNLTRKRRRRFFRTRTGGKLWREGKNRRHHIIRVTTSSQDSGQVHGTNSTKEVLRKFEQTLVNGNV